MTRPRLTRLADWESRLNEFTAERLHRPFEWGAHDCALFGADAVAAITGEDFGTLFRGRYRDAPGAALALREQGGGTLVRTFDRYLRRVPVAHARRGDLAMARGSIGLVMGGFALFVGEGDPESGLQRIPRAEWRRAWAVG